MNHFSTLDSVVKMWQHQGVWLLPPADESTVVTELRRTGRMISRDVIDLYCMTGGMADGDSYELWSLWPLKQIVAENSKYKRPYILFADFLINSHLYCLKYESEKTSAVLVDFFDGEEPKRVADSLVEFFELYLRDPNRLEIWDLSPKCI